MKRDQPIGLIVFDGVCKLCNGFVNLVLEHDRDQRFYFTAAQSEIGSQLMQQAGGGHSGDPLSDYQSVLLVKSFGSTDVVIKQ